jgi:putative transposase
VSEVLPVLYLRGLSTGDFREGLAALLGENAAGLSPSAITRLTSSWQEEYRAWRARSLADRDYVYVWADGVHFNVRLEDERLAALVVIGARPDGTKEVVALEDGYRESTESWLALLRDLKERGMRAPGGGSWRRSPRLLGGDPGGNPRDARGALLGAQDRQRARQAAEKPAAQGEGGAARDDERTDQGGVREVGRHLRDRARGEVPEGGEGTRARERQADDPLRAAGQHWKHRRTTNPIESTFATVKLRQRVTKGAGSRGAGLAMAYRLLLLAESSWRRLTATSYSRSSAPASASRTGCASSATTIR